MKITTEADSFEFYIDDSELETVIDDRINNMSPMDIWYLIEDEVPTYDDEIHDLEMQVKNLRTSLKHLQRMAVRANRPNKYARYQ
jgi:hypothetical protein